MSFLVRYFVIRSYIPYLQEVFEVISPSAVRRLKEERPGNVEALLRMAVSHLEKV